MTLDDFATQQGIGDVDLLKVDTESFEAHQYLRGARSVLARTKYLLIEITFEGNQNYTISSLMSLLQSDGYDLRLSVSLKSYGCELLRGACVVSNRRSFFVAREIAIAAADVRSAAAPSTMKIGSSGNASLKSASSENAPGPAM